MTTATDRPPLMKCDHCAAGKAACDGRKLISGRDCCDHCTHGSERRA
jgi:hypothetical protein